MIASGRHIRVLGWLRRLYGKGRWRKLKGRGSEVAVTQAMAGARAALGLTPLVVAWLFGPLAAPAVQEIARLAPVAAVVNPPLIAKSGELSRISFAAHRFSRTALNPTGWM